MFTEHIIFPEADLCVAISLEISYLYTHTKIASGICIFEDFFFFNFFSVLICLRRDEIRFEMSLHLRTVSSNKQYTSFKFQILVSFSCNHFYMINIVVVVIIDESVNSPPKLYLLSVDTP